MNTNWYQDFFHGIAVDVWRKSTPPEQTTREVSFLEHALEIKPPARVLDVPCGLGRHSVELAAKGFDLTGVDLAPEMIAGAKESAEAAGVEVDWLLSDMRDLPWDATFDAGFCFGNSFGYFDPGGIRSFVGALSRSLKPGARFALDFGMAAECVLPNLRDREWTAVDDILFLEKNHYNAAESRLETCYTFVHDGESHTRTSYHWVYTTREIRQFFAAGGFETINLIGSIEGSPFEVGSPYLILVVKKSENATDNP